MLGTGFSARFLLMFYFFYQQLAEERPDSSVSFLLKSSLERAMLPRPAACAI
ncbi:MAG: hypothetical protein R3E89_14515 [Thiolinea sp.]